MHIWAMGFPSHHLTCLVALGVSGISDRERGTERERERMSEEEFDKFVYTHHLERKLESA